MLNIKEHTLRFWEKEFPILKPKRTANGRRGYSLEDINLLQTIKRLLYDQGYTTKGALKELIDSQLVDVVIQEDGLFDFTEKSHFSHIRKEEISKVNRESSPVIKPIPAQSLEKKVQQELILRVKNKIDDLIQFWENEEI